MKSIFIRSFLIIFVFFQTTMIAFTQESGMKNFNRLSSGFYKGRRDALRQLMPPNSVFVVFAAPEKTFSADVDYVFHQNPDMLYFSGYPEPNSMMCIFKDEQKIEGIKNLLSEVIFVPVKQPGEILTSGQGIGTEEAMKDLGIQLALEASEFEDFPMDFSGFDIIAGIPPSDVREGNSTSSLSGLIRSFRKKAGINYIPDNMSFTISNYIAGLKDHEQEKVFLTQVRAYIKSQAKRTTIDPLLLRYFNSNDSLSRIQVKDTIFRNYRAFISYDNLTTTLRQIKTAEEIKAIREAVDITCSAHREVMKAAAPDMSEREIQGIHEFMYRKSGAKEIGFPLIIASGNNGCTLHYQDNDAPEVGNTLVLMDAGAMVCGYSADVTRTIPASGRFSPEQHAIYNIVLEAQDSAFSRCMHGTSTSELDLIARKVIADGLKNLGIIENAEQSFIYYPHGVSHPIGLDVHDKSGNNISLGNGMIITLEPGIYIPVGSKCDKKWWGIAVRIEDDILINNAAPENLSLAAPRKAKDIEVLMKKKSPFNKFN